MLYPTIDELTHGEFNRYELALATAKCARMITDEYVRQREAIEKSATGNKEIDKNLLGKINKEYRDEKAVKLALTMMVSDKYKIVREDPSEHQAQPEAPEEHAEAEA
ncbi:MAG: DNA-directed RNA polymerase subunit omega [Eubacteriales bacterium]